MSQPLAPDPAEAMPARLRALAGLADWSEAPDEAEEAWNAPYGPAESWDLRVRDTTAPGPHGPVPLRLYAPAGRAEAPRPVLVWCHGGSFQHGDLDMPEADATARGVAGRADAMVVSVDYRLCDEPPGGSPARAIPGHDGTEIHAPIPRQDVVAAVAWTREHASELGVDPARLALGGTSAGGNLAAAAALELAGQGAAPAASLLIYPVTHPLNPEPTAQEARDLAEMPALFGFPPEKMRSMAEAHLGAPLEQAGPLDFPGLAGPAQLAALPPTYIEVDQYGDLRRGARRYAEQLAAAGVEVACEVREGVTHGHLDKLGLAQAARTMDRMAEVLRAL